MQFWNELEGQLFDRTYPLRRLMRSEGRGAWFETQTGDGQRATISLIESLTDADEVTERLEAAQRLRNGNLLAIRKVGRARLENTLFVYALMEYAEQNLSDVLRQQPLPKEDAQQVAEALTGALTAIHQQGLLHGRVEPASVVAVGETVKLRSDCLQTPGATRAGDIAGIGATLFEAFTQRKAQAADDAQINRLPAPFAEIVRNSLSSRWGLSQIATTLGLPAPPAPPAAPRGPAAPPAAAKPPASISVSASPASVKPVSTAQAPPQVAARTPFNPSPTLPGRISTRKDEDDDSPESSRPVALYATIAVLVLLLAGWLVFRSTSNSTGSFQDVQASHPAAAPRQMPDTRPPAVQPAPAPAASPEPEKSSAATPAEKHMGAAGLASRPVWRVIAFTYDRQDQAQHKADEIARQHSDLQPSVFSVAQGGHPRFLVALGGVMDRGRALALRDRATKIGLPPDTYIQNFSR